MAVTCTRIVVGLGGFYYISKTGFSVVAQFPPSHIPSMTAVDLSEITREKFKNFVVAW